MVLGAGRLNILALREMSKVVRVIALDKEPYKTVDDPKLKILKFDFAQTNKLLDFLKKQEFDGVYAMNDHAILPAARVVNKFKIKGNSCLESEALIDKSVMRKIWLEKNLSQPNFIAVNNFKDATKAAGKIGFPLIIKPAASGGAGRGVFKVNSMTELKKYYPSVKNECRYARAIIIEEYIQGIESSLEVIFIKQKAFLLAISSKAKPSGNSQVATEIVYPAQLSPSVITRIFNLVTEAGLALGIANGVGHFEVITDNNDIPFLVEVGGRAGGGHTFHPVVSHVSGINYPQLVAHLYAGNFDKAEKMLCSEIKTNSAVYSFPVTENSGIIKEITFGTLPAENCIAECWKKNGDSVEGFSSSMDRLGCLVLLSNKEVQNAINASREIMSQFKLDILPN